LACSHYRSISEVCRQLSINRAQFNKYLSGQSRPTPYNLKRIGDFFGVEDYELNLPPEQFARLIARNPAAQQNNPISELFRRCTIMSSICRATAVTTSNTPTACRCRA
jgi:transcriptional regulator with XRE-family HTH domain